MEYGIAVAKGPPGEYCGSLLDRCLRLGWSVVVLTPLSLVGAHSSPHDTDMQTIEQESSASVVMLTAEDTAAFEPAPPLGERLYAIPDGGRGPLKILPRDQAEAVTEGGASVFYDPSYTLPHSLLVIRPVEPASAQPMVESKGGKKKPMPVAELVNKQPKTQLREVLAQQPSGRRSSAGVAASSPVRSQSLAESAPRRSNQRNTSVPRGARRLDRLSVASAVAAAVVVEELLPRLPLRLPPPAVEPVGDTLDDGPVVSLPSWE